MIDTQEIEYKVFLYVNFVDIGTYIDLQLRDQLCGLCGHALW